MSVYSGHFYRRTSRADLRMEILFIDFAKHRNIGNIGVDAPVNSSHIEIGIQFFGELQLHAPVDSAHVDAALAELRDTDLHPAVNSGDVRISHRLRDFDFSVDSAQTNRAFNLSDIHAAV